MVDIAEQICKAVDQIVTKKIESINFDTTIIATIEKADQAKQQKYTCSNGSAQFIAFSKDDTYKVGDTVLVTIPNNDYDQQKIIIGKYVAKESKPFNYVEPFDTFIDVSANLIDTTQTNNLSLLANEIIEGQEDVKIIEKLLYSQFSSKSYKGFNRLGLKGQFRSWLAELETVSGNYGYRLEILSSMGTLIKENSDMMEVLVALGDLRKKILLTKQLPNNWETVINKIPEDWFVNKNYQTEDVIKDFKSTNSIEEKLSLLLLILSEKLKISNMYLSSNDMYGNPYNFQGYFEQEKVYDISDIGEILGVSLWFYEETGTFKDKQGKLIPYRFDPNDALTRRDNNLFTKDPYICLGYDLSGFNEEQAILYSLDSDSFYIQDDIPEEQNHKIIRLRWLHQFEDDKIQVVNEATKMDKPYEIRWYRFELGKPSADEYSGVYWVRQDSTEESPFNFLLKPKPNTDIEQVKAIILYGDQEDKKEKIKVIESNILTFKSDDPEGATNASTQKTLAGLSIWCEDNSYGNYFVYGQNNQILESEGADGLSENKELTLQAKFTLSATLTEEDINKPEGERDNLEEAKSITWEFPLRNSMLVVQGINYQGDPDDEKSWILPGMYTNNEKVKVDVENNVIKITKFGTGTGLSINSQQHYRIQGFYNASAINNTVKCTIVKNSKIYSTIKEFNFGLRGTSGTDVTLVINFNDNKTALTAEPFKNKIIEGDTVREEDTNLSIYDTLKITARLFDSAYKEVDFNNEQYNDVKIDWSWLAYNQNLIGNYTNDDSQKKEYVLRYLKFEENRLESLENKTEKEEKTLQEINNLITAIENKTLTQEQEEVLDSQYLDLVQQKYSCDIEGVQNGYGDIQIDSYNKNNCILKRNQNLILNDKDIKKNYFHVLQCKITGWGDYAELIAYKAIPIRLDQRLRNIIGPVDIVYDSKGDIHYNKIPYELWGTEDKINIEALTDVVKSDIQLVSFNNIKWRIYNPFNERLDLIGNIAGKSFNILQPCPLYTKDVSLYGVQAIRTIGEDQEEILWSQPLVILQNRYPSATLNSWNGKSVDIEGGTIVAPAIAAGRKESDNSFSGVMLGDWSKTDTEDSISKQTGLYGFHWGQQSFGFKEDGTAFIGKPNRGRIEFNGTDGVIKSSIWDTKQEGMFLDLDDGIFKLQKNSQYEVVTDMKDYKPNEYYIFTAGYYPIPLKEEWSAGKDYYLFQLQDLGLLTRNEFLTKQETNDKQTFYRKNIIYKEVSDFKEDEDYYVDGYVRVIITKDQYDEAYGTNKSKKYYILEEEFELSSGDYNSSTDYYTRYQMAEVTKNLYDNSLKDGKSETYYIRTKTSDGQEEFKLSEGDFSSSQKYWIESYKKVSITENLYKDSYDDNSKKSKKYYIKKSSNYVKSTGIYFAETAYYMTTKVAQTFSTKEEFDAYKSNKKIYIIDSISYELVKSKEQELHSEIQEYAEYTYVHCVYNVNGPEDEDWNTKDDDNLTDDIKYKDERGSYYIYSEGYEKDSRPEYIEGETYYTFNADQEQRFITISAQESKFPFSIGTTNAISQRKFKAEWDGTIHIENGVISGIITANELYCDYGYIGGWEIDNNTLSGGKTILHSRDGISTNKISIIDQFSSESKKTDILGEIGLIYGSTNGSDKTYNVGIVSKNQSIILDTTEADGKTSNIAFRSKTGAWAQCKHFYIMGIDNGWQSDADDVQIFSKSFSLNTPAENQYGIYARFA